MNIDPKPVIQRAYNRASRIDTVMYVESDGREFIVTPDQPPATKSHWRVNPNGDLDAHTDAHPGQTQYTYERV